MFKISVTDLLETGKNEIDDCLDTLVALVNLEGLPFRLLLSEFLLKLQELLADGWRHFSPERSSEVFLGLTEFFVDFCDGGTAH